MWFYPRETKEKGKTLFTLEVAVVSPELKPFFFSDHLGECEQTYHYTGSAGVCVW